MALKTARPPGHALVAASLVVASVSLVLACSAEEPGRPYIVPAGSGVGGGGQGAGKQGPLRDDAGSRDSGVLDGGPDSGASCTFLDSASTNEPAGCTLEERYSCRGVARSIFCDCKDTLTCTCGGAVILADCSAGCARISDDLRTQCGVDTVPPLRDAGPGDF